MDSTVQTDIDTPQRHAQTKLCSMENLQVNSQPIYVPSVTHPMYTIDETLEHAPLLLEENENGLYGQIGNVKQGRQSLSEPKLAVTRPDFTSTTSNNADDQRAVMDKCSKSFEEYKEGGHRVVRAEYCTSQRHGCEVGSGLDGHAAVQNDRHSSFTHQGPVFNSFHGSEESSFYDSDSDSNDQQPITSDANSDGGTTSSDAADTISTDESTGSDEDSAIDSDSNCTGDFDSDGDSAGDGDSDSESNGNMDDESEDDADTTSDSANVSGSEGDGDDVSDNGSNSRAEDDSDSESDNASAPRWDQVEERRGRTRGSTRL